MGWSRSPSIGPQTFTEILTKLARLARIRVKVKRERLSSLKCRRSGQEKNEGRKEL